MYKKQIIELTNAVEWNEDALAESIAEKNDLQQLIFKQFQQVQRVKKELDLLKKEQVWYDYLNPKCPILGWLGW